MTQQPVRPELDEASAFDALLVMAPALSVMCIAFLALPLGVAFFICAAFIGTLWFVCAKVFHIAQKCVVEPSFAHRPTVRALAAFLRISLVSVSLLTGVSLFLLALIIASVHGGDVAAFVWSYGIPGVIILTLALMAATRYIPPHGIAATIVASTR